MADNDNVVTVWLHFRVVIDKAISDTDNFTNIIDKASERLNTVGAAAGSGITELGISLKSLGSDVLEQFAAGLERVAASLRKVKDEANTAKASNKESPVKKSKATSEPSAAATKTPSAADAIKTEMEAKTRDIDARKNIGEISASEAAHQTVQAQTEALEKLRGGLEETISLRNCLQKSPGVGDPDEAKYLAEVNAELSTYNSRIQETTQNQQKQALASNSVMDGINAGMANVSSKIQSTSQITANFIGEVSDQLGKAFSASIKGMIDGTKNVSDAFRDMGKNILTSMADLFAKQAANQLMEGLLGNGKAGNTGMLGSFFSFLFGSKTPAAHGGYVGADGRVTQSFATGGVVASWNRGIMKSFAAGGYVGDPAVPLGLPRSADDRFLVAVRGGEGFIRPEAVDWLGGPNVIHAINRLTLPALALPRYSFAAGGVVPSVSASAGGGAAPVVIQNVVGIGDSELDRIASSSQNRQAVMASIASNPREVRRILGLS